MKIHKAETPSESHMDTEKCYNYYSVPLSIPWYLHAWSQPPSQIIGMSEMTADNGTKTEEKKED
jgi:hypothetical protein